MRIWTLIAIPMTLALPGPTFGQETRDWVGQDPDTCRFSVDSIRSGEPFPERSLALWYLRKCGAEGASTLAQELMRLRTTTDSAALAAAYGPIASVVDARILDVALEVAADREATSESRLLALRLLTSYRGGMMPSLSSFRPGNSVVLDVGPRPGSTVVTPLPPNWERAVRAVLNRIATDVTETPTLRHAASWALSNVLS